MGFIEIIGLIGVILSGAVKLTEDVTELVKRGEEINLSTKDIQLQLQKLITDYAQTNANELAELNKRVPLK